MELVNLKKMELQNLDQWFATLVDTLNYDIGLINGAVGSLTKNLTTVDTAPIQYLKESLNKLIIDLNESFEVIGDTFDSLDERITALEEGA